MARKSGKKGRGESGPWRVDGMSADTIAAAKRAAADAGVALDVWLSRLIRETAQRERIERDQRREHRAEN